MKTVMKPQTIYTALCLLILILIPNTVAGEEIYSNNNYVVIELAETGDAIVTYTLSITDAPVTITIPVIGSVYLAEAYDVNGEEVPLNITNNNIEIYVFENTTITVRYLTLLAVRNNRIWSVNITLDQPT